MDTKEPGFFRSRRGTINEPKGDPILLMVRIEDYEEFKSAQSITLTNTFSENTIKEVIHKIAKKGNVRLISSNYAYGDIHFDLFLLKDSGAEEILDKNKKLRELGFTQDQKPNLILRKKKREEIKIIVIIDDWEKLQSARSVGIRIYPDQTIQETLRIVCQKESVRVPGPEQKNYGLYSGPRFLDLDTTIESLNIGREVNNVLTLKKDPEDMKGYIIEIEDYKEFNCVRQTTATFKNDTLVGDIILKISQKGNVQIPKEQIEVCDLILRRHNIKLDKQSTIGSYPVRNGDSLILRKMGQNINNIKSSEVEITEKIGSGTFGKVYKGLYNGMEVAVKVIKDIPDERYRKEFDHEVSILRQTNCPYIIKCFGTIEEAGKLMIVMEYATKSSLYHVLHSPLYSIEWERAFDFAIGATQGLLYLHSLNPPILHRDLKSLNILVTENWSIKICDFGTSRLMGNNMDTFRRMTGTPAWTAPELMKEEPFTAKSDVYSLGITLWEIIHRLIKGKYQRPFGEFKDIMNDYQIILRAEANVRPTIPEETPQPIAQLLRDTVQSEPEKRPSTADVLKELERLKKEYEKQVAEWDALLKKANS